VQPVRRRGGRRRGQLLRVRHVRRSADQRRRIVDLRDPRLTRRQRRRIRRQPAVRRVLSQLRERGLHAVAAAIADLAAAAFAARDAAAAARARAARWLLAAAADRAAVAAAIAGGAAASGRAADASSAASARGAPVLPDCSRQGHRLRRGRRVHCGHLRQRRARARQVQPLRERRRGQRPRLLPVRQVPGAAVQRGQHLHVRDGGHFNGQ